MSLDEAIVLAKEKYSAGRFIICRNILQQILAAAPHHGQAQNLLGAVYYDLGNFEASAEQWEKFAKTRKNNSDVQTNFAEVYRVMKKYARAEEHGRRAIELDPESAAAHNNFGIILQEQGRDVEALEHIDKSIELEPDYAKAHHNLGNVLKSLGQRDEAKSAFRKAIAMKPRFAKAHCSLGLTLNAEDELDEAVACFKKAIAYSPKDSRAHVLLGDVLQEQGDPMAAVACYRRALEVNPNDDTARNNLGIALPFVVRPKDAVKHLRLLAVKSPRDAESRRRLGGTLWAAGQTDDALAVLDEALALEPGDGATHRILGLVHKTRGEINEALACFRRALELDHGDVFARAAEATTTAGAAAAKALTGNTKVKRVALYMNQPYHYNILLPAFAALRGRQVVAMVSEVQELMEFAPDVVVLADTHAALLRARLPVAVYVWVRHGLISKNTSLYGVRVSDYACMTSVAGRDWYIANDVRPRRDWWITGYLQMDPLFRDGSLPLPIDVASDRKLVLYAPTWNAELSSALMLGERVAELALGGRNDITLVIKPHPVTFEQTPAWLDTWRGIARADPNVHLVDDMAADIMPWLKAADTLISDASSAIFQFLAVDRPIVLISNPDRFASAHFDRRGPEWQWRDVGEEIDDIEDLPAAVGRALDDPSRGAPTTAGNCSAS